MTGALDIAGRDEFNLAGAVSVGIVIWWNQLIHYLINQFHCPIFNSASSVPIQVCSIVLYSCFCIALLLKVSSKSWNRMRAAILGVFFFMRLSWLSMDAATSE
jgi:hypothetical protein